MSICPYYWYNYNSFACKKSGKDINSDIYYKYCYTYDYRDCPTYKADEQSSSGWCFLTSACVEAMGLADDCHELTVLRAYRDGYLRNAGCGQCEIDRYYRIAPGIVAAIRALPESDAVFAAIYRELVLPCVALIERNEMEAARALYRDYTLALEQKYIPA